MKRLLALLLAAAMLLSLTACKTEPPAPVETEPTVPPTTEPPAPTAEEIYRDAVAALTDSDNFETSFTFTLTRDTGAVEIAEDCEQRIFMENYGRENFYAEITDTTAVSGGSVKSKLTYSGGILLNEVGGETFCSETTEEDFLDGQYPVALLDPACYETVTENADGTLSFTDAVKVEDWLGGSEELTEAQGTVTLFQGRIRSIEYTACYTLGGVDFRFEGKIQVKTRNTDSRAKTLAVSDRMIQMEDASDASLLFIADAALRAGAAPNVTVSLEEISLSQVGGGYSANATFSWLDGEDYTLRLNENINYYSPKGTETESTDILYADGIATYTTVENGKESTGSAAKTRNWAKDFESDAILEYDYFGKDVKSVECDLVGGLYLFTVTYTEDRATSMQRAVCANLFGNPKLLENLAEDYRTEAVESYYAVDPYTMLPTACGYRYEGYHTLEGEEYMILDQADYAYVYAYYEVYDEIHEEMPEPVEPEEKATPALYHVTDAEGHEMWLLGTIHVGDDRTAFLPQELYDAFDACDALAIEVDTDKIDERIEEDEEFLETVRAFYFYDDETTLADHLDEDVYTDSIKLLKATGCYNSNIEHYKPEILGQMIGRSMASICGVFSYDRGVEDQLRERANENEMEILSIEPYEMHISMFADYGDDMQQFYLESSLHDTRAGTLTGERELFETWCRGDEEELLEQFNEDEDFENMTDDELRAYMIDEEDYEEVTDEDLEEFKEFIRLYRIYQQAMIIDRNEGMLQAALEYLASGRTVFYAVGTAHLFDHNGLVQALRDAGCTVEKVVYAG